MAVALGVAVLNLAGLVMWRKKTNRQNGTDGNMFGSGDIVNPQATGNIMQPLSAADAGTNAGRQESIGGGNIWVAILRERCISYVKI